MRVWTSAPAVCGKISSVSESCAPFRERAGGAGRDEAFFEESLRADFRFTFLEGAFSRFSFGFLCALALAGFFGEGRPPPRACFLEWVANGFVLLWGCCF